jgi:TolB-like protein/class 3 adenylate cyclase
MSEGTQRRLAAIVSTDVVGYSRLIGADEASTLAALKAHRSELIDPLIAEHGGRIVKTMGDGLLLEFPSVVGAVNCSIAVQLGMAGRNETVDEDRRLTFRIGINLGDIAIDDDDIHGDGVNVAARLQEVSEPGGLALSGVAYESLGSLVEATFADGGQQQFKNIARPVRVWRWSPDPSTFQSGTEDRPAVAPSSADATGVPASFADKPAIAVLPFTNMSADPEQEYFADGIAEDIITGLSRFRNFLVIARNTTFTYKGQAVDVGQVSRDLKARYVVEGSVRKAGNRIRVTAQLIDGDSGAHIWADRYDGVLEDIFNLQDEITSAIVSTVAPQSMHAEVRRASDRRDADLGTWDLLMRARWHMCRYNRADSAEALRLLRAVVANDGHSAQAYGWLAFTAAIRASYGWTDDPPAALTEAVEAARQAVALDPMDATAHAVGWLAPALEQRHADAIASCRHAVALNPNLAMAHGMLALMHGVAGHYDEAVVALAIARRLSPLDPELPLYATGVAMGAFAVGRYDDVLRLADEAAAAFPDIPAPCRLRAAAFAQLDQPEQAKRELDRLLVIAPGLTIAKMQAFLPVPSDVMQRHIDALRKAGLPE